MLILDDEQFKEEFFSLLHFLKLYDLIPATMREVVNDILDQKLIKDYNLCIENQAPPNQQKIQTCEQVNYNLDKILDI